MALATKLRRAPVRLATGAFILYEGVENFRADEQTAKSLHAAAATAFPFLNKVDPKLFATVLAAGETIAGGMLLAPFVPAGLAGIALIGFSSALLAMYARTPGAHDRYFLPTGKGVGNAKDIWMLGAGVGLVVDAALSESPVTSTEPS